MPGIHVYKRTRTHVHTFIYTHRSCIYADIHIIHIMYTYRSYRSYMHASIHTCTHTHTFTYIHIHTYIHTYIHSGAREARCHPTRKTGSKAQRAHVADQATYPEALGSQHGQTPSRRNGVKVCLESESLSLTQTQRLRL